MLQSLESSTRQVEEDLCETVYRHAKFTDQKKIYKTINKKLGDLLVVGLQYV